MGENNNGMLKAVILSRVGALFTQSIAARHSTNANYFEIKIEANQRKCKYSLCYVKRMLIEALKRESQV